ncbi:MAG: SseB family protein [Desulfuromonadales bacterium]|nr:SseB family protein [Desulfuromonadales bacterium]
MTTKLDQALQAFEQDRDDPANQSGFFDLFLNSTFFIPTVDGKTEVAAEGMDEQGHVVPLVIEAEGKDFLMLFDTEERLRNWAEAETSFVEVAGHVVAAMSEPPLHWALNVGSEPSKLFQPEEIAWLKEVVAHCEAEAGKTPAEP